MPGVWHAVVTMSDDTKTLDVDASTIERFHEKRKETKTQHVPAMDASTFLSSLLDTLEAVEEGYYNDE